MTAGEVDIRCVVESNIVGINGFAGVRPVGFDLQFPRDIVGYFDVGELRVGFEIEADPTVFVAQSRYRRTSGTLVELDVESLGDGLESDHLFSLTFQPDQMLSSLTVMSPLWIFLVLNGSSRFVNMTFIS